MPTSIPRRRLTHRVPWQANAINPIFFVTACTKSRTGDPLLQRNTASDLILAARHYDEIGAWSCALFLVMPDHCHALVATTSQIEKIVGSFKRATARRLSIDWQRNFFDHRIRNEAEFHEKAEYVLLNPVRAGLVKKRDDWPYKYVTRNW